MDFKTNQISTENDSLKGTKSNQIGSHNIGSIRLVTGRSSVYNTSGSELLISSPSSSTSSSSVTKHDSTSSLIGLTQSTASIRHPSQVRCSSGPSSMVNSSVKLQLLILGASQVGKTCIVRRLQNRCDLSNIEPTIGPDLYRFRCGTMEAIDIGGSERCIPIAKAYCDLFHTFVIVFDITNAETFLLAKFWLDYINSHKQCQTSNVRAYTKPKIVLVGNKCDLHDERKVSRNLARSLAMTYEVTYLEISARYDLMLDKIVDATVDAKVKGVNSTP